MFFNDNRLERIERIVERNSEVTQTINNHLDNLETKVEKLEVDVQNRFTILDARFTVLDNKLEAYEKASDKVLRFATTIIVAVASVILIQALPAAIAAFAKTNF